MAEFVEFTDNDGVAWRINPDQVMAFRESDTVSGKVRIILQDGTRLLSGTASLATVEAMFDTTP